MTTLLLNGAAGSWDELAVALVAVGVLWLAVKLAGRKQAGEENAPALDDFPADEGHD
ncbi:MAG: hypothetical protein ACR2IK_19140 [Chloroflexota bacterium]